MQAIGEQELTAEVKRLRALLTDSVSTLPADWRLTPAEETIFRALLAHDVATPALVMEAANTTRASARVVIHRIRTKLASRGVEIDTLIGKGWRLIGRETWAQILAPSIKEGVN